MTARKDPADLKIRARDDLTPKPRHIDATQTAARGRAAFRGRLVSLPAEGYELVSIALGHVALDGRDDSVSSR